MDRTRIVSLVLGLLTVLVMVVVGFAMKRTWLDTVTGLSALGALGVFLMTIRSWMKEPFPRPKDDKREPPNVAGIVLAIAVGSVLASSPYALCGCASDKPIVKANPEAANCIADKGILERECVLNGKTEVDVDTCIANVRVTKSCTDGGK